MRPKFYFVLHGILIVAAAALLFLVSVFFVSFVLYVFHVNNGYLLPGFGSKGVHIFFIIFPWIPVAVALLLTVALGVVLRQYSFVYRQPLLYLPIGLIAVVTLVSVLVHITPFHSQLDRFSRQRGVPLFNNFYDSYHSPDHGKVTVGKVVSISTTTWQLQMKNGQIITATLSSCQPCPEISDIHAGDMVVVFGNRSSNQIAAVGFKKIISLQNKNVSDPEDAPPGF